MWIHILMPTWIRGGLLHVMCLLLVDIMSWKTTLQHVVSQSTTNTEYIAIAEACKSLFGCVYVELCEDDSCINLFSGNQSDIYLTKGQMFNESIKQLMSSIIMFATLLNKVN
jgi:hypothetical protein